MTAMLGATWIKEENVMGFHVQPHYISQRTAFGDVATCHIHFNLKQDQEKTRETDVYRHICLDGNCFLTQILHTSRSSGSRSLHLSTISYSKNNTTFQTLEPFISLGEKVGRCMCLGGTDRAVSVTEPVPTAPSVRPSSADVSSTCHLMMETDRFENMIFFCFNTKYDARVKKST